MSSAEATVADYMTPSPYTIGSEQSAREALRRMHVHHIHHLPVLHGGELVGMVSERDSSFVVELSASAESITVEDVMSSEPYCVHPQERLANVAATMARRRIGSAVVMQAQEVVGVLTATDALYALVDQLRAGVGEPESFAEHRALQLRLARHARVRQLIATTDRAAAELLVDPHSASARAALSRRLPRLLRVLSVQAEQSSARPQLEAALESLGAVLEPLEDPQQASAVGTAVHAGLQRLRDALEQSVNSADRVQS